MIVMKFRREDYKFILPVFDWIMTDLQTPGLWLQGDFAEDKDGYSVHSSDPNAVKWCLLGLIEKHTYHNGAAKQLVSAEIVKEIQLRTHDRYAGIIYYNDKLARDANDVFATVCETKQAVFQKSLPWWNWYRWIPRAYR